MRDIDRRAGDDRGADPGPAVADFAEQRAEPGIHVWTAPGLQGLAARIGLVDCGHVSGLCVRSDRPLAQMGYADRVPNIFAMSEHHGVPRGVPILGSTDRHLAAFLASA